MLPQYENYMRLALAQAELAREMDEVPVGAVIVQRDTVIAQAHNRRERDKNALAHAEMLAIDEAAHKLGGWRLPECTLYVTLEPCVMCAGAILHARIETVVFGAYDPKGGAFGSVYDIAEGKLNHKPQVVGGILRDACGGILTSYFRSKRK